jgi:hypothetical protein
LDKGIVLYSRRRGKVDRHDGNGLHADNFRTSAATGAEPQDQQRIPVNSSLLNRVALKWLREAKEDADPGFLHLLGLAYWGLENGAEGEWPARDRNAVELQIGLLLRWKPENVIDWLLSNPNGGDREEQESNLLSVLQRAKSPNQAAAFVLNAIYSRQQSVFPALQPAASELR